MYRRLNLIMAVMLICLFSSISLAQAASTFFSVDVHNKSGSIITVVKSGDWSGSQKMSAGTDQWFYHKNTAWYLKTKKYDHDIKIKIDGKSYCKCDIWLKNKVCWDGTTKITDQHYQSNSSKCILKEIYTPKDAHLPIKLTIK